MYRSLLVASFVVLAAACDVPRSPVASDGTPSPRGPVAARSFVGLDGEFAELAREVPGFGGYYFSASGELSVVVTDPARADAVRDAVARRAPRHGAPAGDLEPASAIRVVKGDYGFDQLADWNQRLIPLLGQGVVFTDADEVANRVRVGVADDATAARVRGELARLGVPREAVIVEHAAPVQPALSLSAYTRPVVGGVEIDPSFGGHCTLGFNAYYVNPYWGAGVGTRAFATASHCTSSQGALDGTTFSQGGVQIGTELADPALLDSNSNFSCPFGRLCRYSDVALVRYDGGVSWTLGGIAHTDYFFSQTAGSTNANPADPFHVTNLIERPLVGDYLGKVGITTGWTGGSVASTCRNFSGVGNILILCQDAVDALASPGDSGSPVFVGLGGSSASLAGIVWGRTSRYDPVTGTTVFQFIFSNMSNIHREFGVLTVA
jgi:hypothetical protein